MIQERNIKHPNFVLGLISYLFLFAGVILHVGDMEQAYAFILVSFLLGAVHWTRSLMDVLTDSTINERKTKRYFWVGLLILLPPLAGMVYYVVSKRKSFDNKLMDEDSGLIHNCFARRCRCA